MANEIVRYTPNRLISASNTVLASAATITATVFTDSGLTTATTAVVGDLIAWDACITFAQSSGANGAFLRMIINDGGTDHQPGPFASTVPSGTETLSATLSGLWTVLNAGTITIKLQGRCTSGVTLTIFGGTGLSTSTSANASSSALRIMQYRP